VFGTESLAQLLQGDPSAHAGEVSPLSNRELFIFKLLGRNLGPTAIAAELGVSVKTIETHQHRIKQKLRLPSCPDLRFRAHEWVLKADLLAPQ
jgi:DNA-binding CsgD family transcriptional regulator